MSGVLSGMSGGDGMNPSQASTEAARAQAAAAKIAIGEQQRQFNLTTANQAPWLKAGKTALNLQNKYAGLGGSQEQKKAFADFMASPEQTYFKQQGTDSLNRNSTALGGIGSPQVVNALKEQGAGWASQDYENQYNRLAGLSNTGQATAGQLGALGQNKSSAIGNIGMQAGQSMASGTLAGQQAQTAQNSQLASAVLMALI